MKLETSMLIYWAIYSSKELSMRMENLSKKKMKSLLKITADLSLALKFKLKQSITLA